MSPADIFCHNPGIFRGQPNVGILFAVMAVFFVVIVRVTAFQQGNVFRGIHDLLVLQQILHKFLQPRAGDHHQLGAFHRFDLSYIQCVIVQAGNAFCHQLCHRQIRSLAQLQGKFINGQGGGSNIRRFSLGLTAAKKQ